MIKMLPKRQNLQMVDYQRHANYRKNRVFRTEERIFLNKRNMEGCL
ncbi:hypothetical protein HMPREF1870_02439 [Bacteroidales bacterium KA00344]|nr:hypothetical protein HMPREF1870_02439 [Bacteroidales bacterium KA00344]